MFSYCNYKRLCEKYVVQKSTVSCHSTPKSPMAMAIMAIPVAPRAPAQPRPAAAFAVATFFTSLHFALSF